MPKYHINVSIQWKSPSPVVLSHSNPLAYLFRTDVNGAWSVHISLLIQVRQGFFFFFLEKAMLQIEYSKLLLHKMLIDWITCRLMWCFYQLFELSFWRHPFTAEDLLVSKWCNAKFLQICFDKETNSATSWMAWGWVKFQQIFIFGWTIPLESQMFVQTGN